MVVAKNMSKSHGLGERQKPLDVEAVLQMPGELIERVFDGRFESKRAGSGAEPFEEMAATYRGEKSRPVYSRTTNPTTRAFEQKIAELECTEDAIGFASGMGAISSTVLAFVEPGDCIVCVEHVYPDAYRLFETLLKRWNVDTVYVDGKDHEAVARALPGARLSADRPVHPSSSCLPLPSAPPQANTC